MSYPRTDPTTGLDVLVKQPGETREFAMDFSAKTHGVALSSVIGVTGSPAGLTITNERIDGAHVWFKIAGGADGTDYKITVQVQDADGNVLEGDGMLYVRDD